MKNLLIILSISCGFGAIAILRGISLGQDHNKYYVAILAALSIIFGLYPYFLNRRNKTKNNITENE